jgi:glycosyltransferase involved in cell wall biosynthesis
MGRVERGLIRRCSHLLAISPFTATWLAKRADIDAGAVTVVPLAVDERFAHAARQAYGGQGDRDTLQLLTVSRITAECRYKGHFTVAEAVAEIVQHGRRIQWTVVGYGDDIPALQQHCANLGIEDHTVLLGRVDDAELERHYATADLLVLPSFADPEASPPVGEGFGLVYAEAGAYGVPSIGSSSGGGSSAFVVDGETGLTVAPESTRELTAAIERLQDDLGLRQRLGEGARRRVLDHHLPRHFCGALRAALD